MSATQIETSLFTQTLKLSPFKKCTCLNCGDIVLNAIEKYMSKSEFETAYNCVDNFELFSFPCDCPSPVLPLPTKRARKTNLDTKMPLAELLTSIQCKDYMGRAKKVTMQSGQIVSAGSYLGALGVGKPFLTNVNSLNSAESPIETFQQYAAAAIARNAEKGVLRMSENTLRKAYTYVLSQLF